MYIMIIIMIKTKKLCKYFHLYVLFGCSDNTDTEEHFQLELLLDFQRLRAQ